MTEIAGTERSLQHSKKRSWKKWVWDYVVITIACVFYAAGVSLFLDPNSLAPGGVTGIAIILNRITRVETGTLIWLINIPIMALGTWKFGVKFILSTLYCTSLISAVTNLLAPIGALTQDPVVAVLAGSTLMAVSMGMIFKAGATTGGTDIIVKVLRLHFPHLKTGALFLLMDAIIVTASAFVFQNIDRAIYAGLTVFLSSVILDAVLYGRDGAKLIYIISDASDAITARLLEELEIGVTHIQGVGAYSGKEKNVIFCAIRKQLAPKAEAIVREEDPLAFMIVTSASEIYGEGYKSIFSEKL